MRILASLVFSLSLIISSAQAAEPTSSLKEIVSSVKDTAVEVTSDMMKKMQNALEVVHPMSILSISNPEKAASIRHFFKKYLADANDDDIDMALAIVVTLWGVAVPPLSFPAPNSLKSSVALAIDIITVATRIPVMARFATIPNPSSEHALRAQGRKHKVAAALPLMAPYFTELQSKPSMLICFLPAVVHTYKTLRSKSGLPTGEFANQRVKTLYKRAMFLLVAPLLVSAGDTLVSWAKESTGENYFAHPLTVFWGLSLAGSALPYTFSLMDYFAGSDKAE